jgi:hypothetical protein
MVLGAEHPDEEEATRVVESLIQNPIPNVKGMLANLLGMERKVRFVDVNMAFAYNRANPNSEKYEERRADEVLSDIGRDNPDTLVTLHNVEGGNVRFAAIDPRRGVTQEVLGMLREFDIRCIVASTFGVIAHRSNSVLIEIPKEDIRSTGIGFVRQFVDDLANHPNLPIASATDFKWFTPARARGLHKDDIHPNELSQDEQRSIVAFERTPRIIQERLGGTKPLYLTSGFKEPNQAGFWSELVVEIEAPNTSHWPS